ncbi:MAG: hypothetical protein ACO4CP_09020, partial [Steroidobacteraceae bacterium]
LTSLSAVIRGKPVTVRGRRRPIDLLFNLEHPDHRGVVTEVHEEGGDEDEDDGVYEGSDDADSTEDDLQKRFDQMTFVVATKQLERLPHWVQVTDVFKADSDRDFLRRAGVTDLDDPRAEKYSKRLARLRAVRKYVYRMDILERSLDYDEVTEIFVRVNSLGAKLRSSDLALAQITAKWRGALAIFQEFDHQCERDGFELELGVHLRNLVVFATQQCKFQTVGNLTVEQLQKAWSDCVPGMEFALNFVKSNAGIDSPALLSSSYVLITLGFYGARRGYRLTAAESRQLRYWLLVANAKGRYSRGSSETLLDQDLTTLRQGGTVEDLIERLRLQVGRLEILPEELAGRNQRSALFKTMFLAFRESGARDWNSNLAVSLRHRGAQHRLQFHHIFPKAILKSVVQGREADDIANLAFIGGKTNRQISDKAPSRYFPMLLQKNGQATFDAQCIPTETQLLETPAYLDFLEERRKRISKRLNEFLGAALTLEER